MRVWHRTMIKGVWFYVDNKVSLADGGLASADAYKVRIPVHADFGGSQYVPPEEYAGADGTWTLKNDDLGQILKSRQTCRKRAGLLLRLHHGQITVRVV